MRAESGKQLRTSRPDNRDFERHFGFATILPNARVRNPCVVPYDLLVAEFEVEVRDEHREYDLCR